MYGMTKAAPESREALGGSHLAIQRRPRACANVELTKKIQDEGPVFGS